MSPDETAKLKIFTVTCHDDKKEKDMSFEVYFCMRDNYLWRSSLADVRDAAQKHVQRMIAELQSFNFDTDVIFVDGLGQPLPNKENQP